MCYLLFVGFFGKDGLNFLKNYTNVRNLVIKIYIKINRRKQKERKKIKKERKKEKEEKEKRKNHDRFSSISHLKYAGSFFMSN